MRRLLFVPIMHSEADMGSAGPALAASARARSGARWDLHQRTVDRFWDVVAAYLAAGDARRLRLYQDGMVVEGDLAGVVVREAAVRGSRNYRLLLDLVAKGAVLRKTEDASLLAREYLEVWGALEGRAETGTLHKDMKRKDLLAARDKAIAGAIGGTLKPGEVGVLFLGAAHNPLDYLAADISVEMLKDRHVVQVYFEELLAGNDDARLVELARHLVAPLAVPPGT